MDIRPNQKVPYNMSLSTRAIVSVIFQNKSFALFYSKQQKSGGQ
jgi:hypothetical protein